ncbi:MAG: VOC family protein [Armatimonadetes bacterium]|nr:VOC family protein [Armatimonadota bacterium]
MIESLSAVTLATHNLPRAIRFYSGLGFEVHYQTDSFVSFRAGGSFLNLILAPSDVTWSWWGRVIVHVRDVDEMYDRARALGAAAHDPPRDAEWGERYFHLTDPDGHELSFARRYTKV